MTHNNFTNITGLSVFEKIEQFEKYEQEEPFRPRRTAQFVPGVEANTGAPLSPDGLLHAAHQSRMQRYSPNRVQNKLKAQQHVESKNARGLRVETSINSDFSNGDIRYLGEIGGNIQTGRNSDLTNLVMATNMAGA